MIEPDFKELTYCPALLSETGEILGYSNSSASIKKLLLPIFELGQRKNQSDLSDPLAEIKSAVGSLPFVLDLHTDPALPPYIPKDPAKAAKAKDKIAKERKIEAAYNKYLNALKKPENNFESWRNFIAELPNAIPTLLYTNLKHELPAVLEQAAQLQKARPIAIRINAKSDPASLSLASTVISESETPERVLLIFDCGQGRTRLSQRSEFARKAIAKILQDLPTSVRPLVRAVCINNSFMKPKEGFFEYENLDRELWQKAKDSFPFIFGDYGAMYRLPRSSYTPGEWKATVVYPLEKDWLVSRPANTNDPDGWIDGATAVTKHKYFDPDLNAWGVSVIKKAAAGNLDGIHSVRYWHAAKVNLHLFRQLQKSA